MYHLYIFADRLCNCLHNKKSLVYNCFLKFLIVSFTLCINTVVFRLLCSHTIQTTNQGTKEITCLNKQAVIYKLSVLFIRLKKSILNAWIKELTGGLKHFILFLHGLRFPPTVQIICRFVMLDRYKTDAL